MAEINEGFLDTLKKAINTSTATGKARAAGDWFREKVKQAGASARMKAITPSQLLRRQQEDNIMYPLVFPFEKASKGFYGINLHYIRPKDRAILMDQLNKFANNRKYDKTTRLKLSYDLLKGYGRAVPCVKRYLRDHVVSETVRIDADEWEIAIFLPVERFQKESKSTVWKDSEGFY